MRKYMFGVLACVLCVSVLFGCAKSGEQITKINLSDEKITVDGAEISEDGTKAVYAANDIIYYEEGKDFTYGEGTEKDAHSKSEADAHTVVHITKPGTYELSGTISKGQIAVDLGKESVEDPEAVVTLILNNLDITCTVAPAVIFYNVYECFGDATEENAVKDVDTSAAGANVIIADDSVNTVNGSYVARIYKPDSVELSEDGKTVKDAKKLHKYDAAFYSKRTMNINGGKKGNGKLDIYAENEGLDSELHLTLNGGNVKIVSGNDGINTNEDNISVTTINGGTLNIVVNGSTGEGDGIDSNGWLVINGGTVISQACGFSMDGGIDSDRGIHINGGTVIASGNMLDRISQSDQTYVVLNFSKFLGKGKYTLKNSDNKAVIECEIENSFTTLVLSNENLTEGDYTLWYEDNQLCGFATENSMGGGFGGKMFEGGFPEGMEMPEGFDPGKMRPGMENMPPQDFNGQWEMPEMPGVENTTPPEFNGDIGKMPPNFNEEQRKFAGKEDATMAMPEGMGERPDKFEGKGGGERVPGSKNAGNTPNQAVELSEVFNIKTGANYFSFVSVKEN